MVGVREMSTRQKEQRKKSILEVVSDRLRAMGEPPRIRKSIKSGGGGGGDANEKKMVGVRSRNVYTQKETTKEKSTLELVSDRSRAMGEPPRIRKSKASGECKKKHQKKSTLDAVRKPKNHPSTSK